jgi:RNA polymerase sigma-70 factor (ECF subfamily)
MTGPTGAQQRPDDRALVARLRAGDEEAFAALVDGWSGWMLRLAGAHVSSRVVAEEVVQETWLAVLEGLRGFRGESSLRTWVYRILVNQAKRHGVRESRSVTVDPEHFQGQDDPHPGGWRVFPAEWPEHVALTREVRQVVATALDELPSRQRVVVALRDLDGHSAEEVCDLLGVSAGNQRVLLHRGRSVVRAHLERYLAADAATTEVAR